MPLIRCPKCGQAYDVPGAVAVRLPNSIATCHCGEWIAGSKAALLARMLDPEKIKEVDLQGYRVDQENDSPFEEISEDDAEALETSDIVSRSVRIVARGGNDSLNMVFTIGQHPLWIGRKGSHIELEEAELDLRHCSISLRRGDLVVRDADSHMGTFLDGQRVKEAVLTEGVHLLRAGSALVSIEPTAETGEEVGPIALQDADVFDDSVLRVLERRAREPGGATRRILVCVDGPLNGQEFEIPPTGLIVGREGHVRVPDEFLSRKHFEVMPDGDGNIRVRDLGSRNGTFLNTLPARDTKVGRGDEIRAGVNRFRIEHRA
ncbi:MAG TPA: FHA domain-containing protein [Thermoanaerobaculia bacterium]|nr:FHA domain-containing protein [Thermoanaerobaculia bacterium]